MDSVLLIAKLGYQFRLISIIEIIRGSLHCPGWAFANFERRPLIIFLTFSLPKCFYNFYMQLKSLIFMCEYTSFFNYA